MRGYIIGASTARLMAPNPPPSVYDTVDNWAKTVYLLTSEGTTEGQLVPAQCSDSTLETGTNGTYGIKLRAAKKLPWANFSISNEGGTGSRIQSFDSGMALALGTGAFTLEGWVACNATNRGTNLFYRHGASGNYGFSFGTEAAANGRIFFTYSPDGTTQTTLWSSGAGSTINDDLFHYIAVDRNAAGVLRIYLDGKMVAKATIPTIFNSTATIWLLPNLSGHGSAMYYDDVRATVGAARYASDTGFITPGARARKGPAGDPYWDFVATYMRFQGDNVSQSYLDNGPYDFHTDNAGNFQQQTATGKFGAANYSSYFMQHPLVYLNSPTRNKVMNLRGKDFTIEFAILPGETDTTGCLMGSWESAKMQWRVRLFQGRVIFETSSSGAAGTKTIDTLPNKLTNAAWNAVVIERAGANVKIYINGVLRGSGALSDSDLFDSGATPQFIPYGVADGGPVHSTLDEFRMTVGVARYAEDGVTPLTPTAQYPAYKASFNAPSNVLLDERGIPLRLEDGQFLTEG